MKSYQPSFFDEAERHIKLDQLKDPLVELDEYIDFEVFRSKLNKVFEKPRLSNAVWRVTLIPVYFPVIKSEVFTLLPDNGILGSEVMLGGGRVVVGRGFRTE